MAASPLSPSGAGADVDDDGRVAIGSVLDGRYRIDALIGTGGMGRVYRGEHTGISRAVAVKVLHHDLNRNREASQRFQREAIASGRLDHPNIVNIYDFGVLPDGACYLVMEALEGETLGQHLEREGRLPWREALDVLRGMLLGLRHAHDRGVVHRDIKPDNVYLARKDGDLIIKILDFGIAKLKAGTADDPASTRAGLTVGTPAYLSPEQAVGGEITPASDLYSASIVLYEMLAGRAPFEDKDPLAMLGAHVSRQPPRFSEVVPDLELPDGLEDVMRAGLVKAAAERTKSAKDYLGLIDRVIAKARRYRTAPVAAVAHPGDAPGDGAPGDGAADPTDGAAVALALGTADTGAVAALPGAPPLAPGASPDQSVMITVEPYASLPGSGAAVMPAQLSGEHAISGAYAAAPRASGAQGAVDERGLPLQARTVALADLSEPIPRRWIVIGGIVVLILIIGAVILAVASSGNYKPSSAPEPGIPSAAPAGPQDRELQLKALIHDLQNGKTCAERKAAIAPLVALGDPRAIEPLKAARHRMRGGVAGIGADNHNACLTREVDAAIKALGEKQGSSGAPSE